MSKKVNDIRLLSEEEREAIAHRKKIISIFTAVGTAILSFVTLFVLPEVLELWFDTTAIETISILLGLTLMALAIWLVLCIFLSRIRKEKDALEDKDKPKIYNDVGIDVKERCIKYVDVCSISRAMNKKGLNIPLKEDDKKRYRIYPFDDIKDEINDAQEITIICEQNNDLTDLDQITNEYLIKKVKEGLNINYLYVEKENREIDIEQMKAKLLTVLEGAKGNITFKEIGDKTSFIGNVLLSCNKVILISKKGDKKGYYSLGYLKYYSMQGEEEIYYKMPFCLLNSYSRFSDEYNKKRILVLKHKGSEGFKEFVFKPLMSYSHYQSLLDINNKVIDEKISNDIFTAPTKEEILESLDKDIVYGVFHHQKLIAFSILILDRNSERDLSNYLPKYKKDVCASFDNVEVLKEYRGYGIEKELINIAKEEAINNNKTHLIAVVSKNNQASIKSFIHCGFEIAKSDIPIYGSTRELVKIDL